MTDFGKGNMIGDVLGPLHDRIPMARFLISRKKRLGTHHRSYLHTACFMGSACSSQDLEATRLRYVVDLGPQSA